MTLRQSRQNRILGRLVERKTGRLPHPRPALVEGRHRDGTARLRHLGGVCLVRGEISGARAGEVVTATPAVIRSRGTAGGAAGGRAAAGGGVESVAETITASASALWVERIEPDVFHAGDVLTVRVIGHGFTESTRIDFLAPETLEISPHIRQLGQALIDPENLEIEIEVDFFAPLIERAPVAWGTL